MEILSQAAELEIAAEEDEFRATLKGRKPKNAKQYQVWSEIHRRNDEEEKIRAFREHGND